ncbi:MAG: sporulation protein Cse60 [Erysipelotrichaceae bacterium]|nr:sporulation protein Cse60 [Erysipelotrichaceae bacterium]
MIQVKAFMNEDITELEEDMNLFLEEHSNYTVFDYKFEITNRIKEIEEEEEIEIDQSIMYVCLLMYSIKSW